jgi:uncharacterized protein (TIGR03000 family)
MALHQDQVTRMNEWLAAHVREQFPACGLSNWWQIHDGFYGLPSVSLDTLNLKEVLEFVATTCKRCGNTGLLSGNKNGRWASDSRRGSSLNMTLPYQANLMDPKRKHPVPLPLTAALLLAAWCAVILAPRALGRPQGAAAPGQAPAEIKVVVPADVELVFDGDPTRQRGTERRFTSPPLDIGRTYHYVILARWNQAGTPVEQTRKVPVTGGATIRVDFLSPTAANGEGPIGKDASPGEDKEVVSSTGVRLTPASSVNFRKQLGLPYRALCTLGARIDAARRANDPVTLANVASELAVAESVSGKTASLTSKALAKDAAKLAALRRQVAELRAVLRVNQQITDEQDDITLLEQSIDPAQQQAKEDQEAINRNLEPTWSRMLFNDSWPRISTRTRWLAAYSVPHQCCRQLRPNGGDGSGSGRPTAEAMGAWQGSRGRSAVAVPGPRLAASKSSGRLSPVALQQRPGPVLVHKFLAGQ